MKSKGYAKGGAKMMKAMRGRMMAKGMAKGGAKNSKNYDCCSTKSNG